MQLAFTSRRVNFVLEIGDRTDSDEFIDATGGSFDIAEQGDDEDSELDPEGFGFRPGRRDG